MECYLHKEFRYKNTDERYVFITKQEAYDAYQQGRHIRIGYQDKSNGAFYSIKQFEHELPVSATKEQKFKYALKRVKECLPYKRIKFRLQY